MPAFRLTPNRARDGFVPSTIGVLCARIYGGSDGLSHSPPSLWRPLLAVMPQTPGSVYSAIPIGAAVCPSKPEPYSMARCRSPECYGQALGLQRTQRIIALSMWAATRSHLAAQALNTTTWAALNCEDQMVAGYDSTVYVVESTGSGTGYQLPHRGVLDSARRWTWTFLRRALAYQREARPSKPCCHDGNLYAVMSTTNCDSPTSSSVSMPRTVRAALLPIRFPQDVSNITH